MVQMIRSLVLCVAVVTSGAAIAQQAVLPPGHPPMPATQPALPPGHPPMPSASQPAMPPGHPPIDHPPTTGPAEAIGKLTIHVSQGTKGGASVAGKKAVVHFYQGEKVIKHVEVTLDDNGNAVVGDVPLTRMPVEAVVMVEFGRVTYRAVSPSMHSGEPEAEAELTVYETINETPEWRIPMRHLMLSQTPQGVRVMEILITENRSDRTWIGNDTHEGATLVLRLPEGAVNLELGEGFEPEAAHLHDGMLLNIVPMTPGMTRYTFSYTIPVKGGKVEIPVRSPTMTQQLMVFAPEDAGEVTTTGLTQGPVQEMEGGHKLRRYTTAALPAGQTVAINLAGLPDSVTEKGESAGWSTPQIIGAAGLGIILIGGAAFILLKPTGGKPQAG